MKTKIFTIIVLLMMLVLSPVFGLAQSREGDNAAENMAKKTQVDTATANPSSKLDSVGEQLQQIKDDLFLLKNNLHQAEKDLLGAQALLLYLLIGVLVLVIGLLTAVCLLWKRLAPERTQRDGSRQGPMTDVDRAVAKSKAQKTDTPATPKNSSAQQEQEIKEQKEANKRLEQENKQLRSEKEELLKEIDRLKSPQVSAPPVQPTPQPSSATTQGKYYIDNIPVKASGELITEPKETTFLQVSSDGTLDIRPELDDDAKGRVITGAEGVQLLAKKGSGRYVLRTEPGKVTIDPDGRSWVLVQPLILVLNPEQPSQA